MVVRVEPCLVVVQAQLRKPLLPNIAEAKAGGHGVLVQTVGGIGLGGVGIAGPLVSVVAPGRADYFLRLIAAIEYTKHMIRLRHANQITGSEANEIILLNSHDDTSSYQMLAGMLRFVCQNGMACGDTLNDICIPHKGNIIHNVIERAFTVLDDFESIKGRMMA